MHTILIVQTSIAVLLVIAILLQNRGEGLGVLGGGGGSAYHTRRGAEKFLVQFTIGLSVAFLVVSLIAARFSS